MLQHKQGMTLFIDQIRAFVMWNASIFYMHITFESSRVGQMVVDCVQSDFYHCGWSIVIMVGLSYFALNTAEWCLTSRSRSVIAIESFSVLTFDHSWWPAIVMGKYGCVDHFWEYKSMGISVSLYSSLLAIFIFAHYLSLVTSLAYNLKITYLQTLRLVEVWPLSGK